MHQFPVLLKEGPYLKRARLFRQLQCFFSFLAVLKRQLVVFPHNPLNGLIGGETRHPSFLPLLISNQLPDVIDPGVGV